MKQSISSLLDSGFGLGLFGLAVAYMYRYDFKMNFKSQDACKDWLQKTAPTNDFTADQRYERTVGWRAGWRWYKDLPETRRDAACAKWMRERFQLELGHGVAQAQAAFPDASPVAIGLAAVAYARASISESAWAALKGPV
jgi:hypothetical protein